MYTSVFRVKTAGNKSPRTVLGVLEEDPSLSQQAAQRQQRFVHGWSRSASWNRVCIGQKFFPRRTLYFPKIYFQKSCRNSSATRTCSLTKILKIKVKFDMSTTPKKCGSILGNLELVKNSRTYLNHFLSQNSNTQQQIIIPKALFSSKFSQTSIGDQNSSSN